VLLGWPLFGMLIETYGFVLLFRYVVPVFKRYISVIPEYHKILYTMLEMEMLKSWYNFYATVSYTILYQATASNSGTHSNNKRTKNGRITHWNVLLEKICFENQATLMIGFK